MCSATFPRRSVPILASRLGSEAGGHRLYQRRRPSRPERHGPAGLPLAHSWACRSCPPASTMLLPSPWSPRARPLRRQSHLWRNLRRRLSRRWLPRPRAASSQRGDSSRLARRSPRRPGRLLPGVAEEPRRTALGPAVVSGSDRPTSSGGQPGPGSRRRGQTAPANVGPGRRRDPGLDGLCDRRTNRRLDPVTTSHGS